MVCAVFQPTVLSLAVVYTKVFGCASRSASLPDRFGTVAYNVWLVVVQDKHSIRVVDARAITTPIDATDYICHIAFG